MDLKIKRSNKPIREIIFLLIASTATTAWSADELPREYFNGLQFAFVRVPVKPGAEEAVVEPKPKPAQTPAPAVKPAPAPAPVVKPAPAPVLKPAPVTSPVVTPAAKPASPSVVKPAATPAAKPPATAAKPGPASKTSRPAASSRQQPIEGVIGFGIDIGGDTLGTLNYTDGSSTPVKANDGFMIYAGVILPNGAYTDFSTQITVGYKNGGARGSGGGAIWTAIPLEVIEFYRVSDLRMGLGISYHLNPQLSVSAPSANYVDKYDNAIGFVAQIGWAPIRAHYGIDLRYTAIKFQGNNVVGPASASGNVVGLFGSYRF